MKKMLLIAAALTWFSVTSALASDNPPSDEKSATEVQVSKEEKKVLQFDEAVVRNIMKEEGYDELYILNKTLELRQMDGRMQPVLDAYLKDRSLLESYDANGTTIRMIMVSERTKFWHGLDYMEICIKDAGIAEQIREQAKDIEDEEKRRGKQQ